MSKWTHSICEDCWNKKNPGRQAVKATAFQNEICCYCGAKHGSGIYVRDNPADMPCNGAHEDES